MDRIALLAGNFKYGDGFTHLTYADSADHKQNAACKVGDSNVPDDVDNDPTPWSYHIHVGIIGKAEKGFKYPKSWDHGKTFCARGATGPMAVCLAALKAFK